MFINFIGSMVGPMGQFTATALPCGIYIKGNCCPPWTIIQKPYFQEKPGLPLGGTETGIVLLLVTTTA
jgi:hypothetical protein